jgi:aerobic-type carbon monoxide dehydrogenase small subunit (CoxS/CutS family)
MSELVKATLNVNGRDVEVATDPQRTLLEVLREALALTGTKYGCGEGACGACAVLIDGKVSFSCGTQFGAVVGKTVTTIEGLEGDSLHPVQRAFLEAEAFQCGYCTPGMIIATVDLLRRKPAPDNGDIRTALNGHLCRCCGYVRIVDAVKRAAEVTRKA